MKVSSSVKLWMRFRGRLALLVMTSLALFMVYNQASELFSLQEGLTGRVTSALSKGKRAGARTSKARSLAHEGPVSKFVAADQDLAGAAGAGFSNDASKGDAAAPVLTIWTILRDLDPQQLQTSQLGWLEGLHTRNAIQSWLKLPQTNVIMFGSETACNYTSTFVPTARFVCRPPPCINTEFNAPTYDCMFGNASLMATTEYVMYANSDMVFFADLLDTIKVVGNTLEDFLMVGERTDVTFPRLIDFDDPSWSSKMRQFTLTYGKYHGKYAIDYFIYRRIYTRPMPPFLVGRVRWDNWLLSRFIGSKTASAVDCSKALLAVHLTHGKIGSSALREGTQYNKDLLKNEMIDPKKIGDLESCDYFLELIAPLVGETSNVRCPNCRLTRNHQSLETILYKAASDDMTIVVASVNFGYLDFAINWMCSMQHVKVDNYLFHATDKLVYQALFDMGQPVIFYESDDAKTFLDKAPIPQDVDENGFAYGTVQYQALMNTRTELIYKILQKGYNCLLSDVDIVFLRNPFLFLDPGLDIQGGAHKDTKITGGFIYMRGARALGIWTKVLHQHREVFRQIQRNPNFNPHEYTEQEVLNRLLLSSTAAEVTWGRVPQEIVSDGKNFFIDKIPQKTGIWPAAIHNNYIVGKPNKYQRFANTSLWFVERDLKCTPFPSLLPLAPSGSPAVVIKVLTFDRPEALKRLLRSLHKAEYNNDQMRLEIYIDYPETDPGANTNRAEVVKLANKFIWPHGVKQVVDRTQHVGLVGQWLNMWFPTTDREVAIVLEDDNVVSPLWYKHLSTMLAKYYTDRSNFDPRVYGIMLQNQHFIPGKYPTKPKELLAPATQFYRYQQLSTWGPVFFPMHWAEFLTWQSERASDPNFLPLFSNMKTNEWYLARGGSRSVWSAHFMRFVAEKGWYAIYGNYNEGAAFVVNYRDKGVNYGKDQGINSPMMETMDGIVYPEKPSKMPLYDFHFNEIKEDPSVLEMRGTYSDTFNINTH